MNEERHCWMTIEKSEFVEGLAAIGGVLKVPKKERNMMKIILALDGDTLVLSTGVFDIHIPASGEWPTPAVFHHRALDALNALVQAAKSDDLITLEGLGDHVAINNAKVSCHFQNPEINVRGAEKAERRLQRVDEINKIRNPELTELTDCSFVLAQIRKLYPNCTLIPPEHLTLVVFPDLPKVLVRIESSYIQFRIINNPEAPSAEWYKDSTVWKMLGYSTIQELGMASLLTQAAQAARRSDSQTHFDRL